MCLETKELPTKHTAENLAASLRDAQRRWKFKTPIAVSDNAANEIKTFQLLKWTRLSCFGHNLNLAVKACLQVEEISAIIFKCRKVVQFFHKSPSSTAVLNSKQELSLDLGELAWTPGCCEAVSCWLPAVFMQTTAAFKYELLSKHAVCKV